MKLALLLTLFSVILISGCTQQPSGEITSFEDCVAAGYPVMESYPRQCAVPSGETFTETLGLEYCNASCIGSGYDVGHCMIPSEICEDDVESGDCLQETCASEGECKCYCKYETPPDDVGCCTKQGSSETMCFAEAKEIAEFSDCTENGTLMDTHFCNEVTGTWWIDLDIEKEGCAPACVVYVETGEAEINWRCTGLIE